MTAEGLVAGFIGVNRRETGQHCRGEELAELVRCRWHCGGVVVVSFDRLGQASTSEITPVESANVPASTPIFCAMVRSRLLKCAFELTGL